MAEVPSTTSPPPAPPAGPGRRLGARGFRHGDLIAALAYAPTAHHLATAGHDGRVRVWDDETGECLLDVAPGLQCSALAWVGDDALVVGGEGGGLMRIDFPGAGAGRVGAKVPGGVTALAWSAGAGILLVGSGEGRVEGRRLDGSPAGDFPAHAAAVQALALDPGGKWFASGCRRGVLRVGAAASPGDARELASPGGYSAALAFSSDGGRLAVGGERAVLLIDPANGSEMARLGGLAEDPCALAFAPGGRVVAAADFSRAVTLFDASQGTRLRSATWEGGYLYALGFRADGARLASACGGVATRWDVATGEPVDAGPGHRQAVRGLAACGERLVSAGADGAACLWRGEALEARAAHPDGPGGLVAVAASPGGERLVVASARGRVLRLAPADGALLEELRASGPEVRDLALSADGEVLAVASWNPRVALLEVEGGRERGFLEGNRSVVGAVVAAPDGTFWATAGWDGGIRLYRPGGGPPSQLLGEHRAAATCLAVGADGRAVASGGGDGAVRIWSLEGGAPRAHSFPGAWVLALAALPDGSWVAGCDDGGVREIAGEEVRELAVLDGPVMALAAAPGGGVAAAGLDGTVTLLG